MLIESITELCRILGRSEKTVGLWRRAKQLDPFGDPVLTGEFERDGHNVQYRTTRDALLVLKDLLWDWEILQKHYVANKDAQPYHIKRGGNRGNEYVSPDDLVTKEIEVRDIGSCKLHFKNREWLHIFDADGGEHRVKLDDVVSSNLPAEECWPIRNALHCVRLGAMESPEWASDIE